MAQLDAAKVAERWASAMSQAGTRYTEGVNATSVNPMALAAANKQGYINGVMEAVNSGKWERGLMRNSPQYWKDQCVKVGSSRLGTGAAAARPKMQAFMAKFLPFQQQVTERVRQMPATTFEERKARAIAQMDGVHQFIRD